MDDRSSTETSSPGFELGDLPVGMVEEVVDTLGALSAADDYDTDEAMAAAFEEFGADLAPLRATVAGVPTLEIGGAVVTFAVGDRIVIGRSGDHRVEHPLVSRRHLAVSCSPRGICAHDLGSANGSWLVRGGAQHAVTGDSVELAPGDRVVTAGGVELLSVRGAV